MNTSDNSRDPTRSNNMKRGSPLSSVMLMPLSKRRKLTTDRVKTSSNPNQQSHRSPLGKDLPDPAQNHTPLQFLQELFHSMYGISLEVRPARELKDFFSALFRRRNRCVYNRALVCSSREQCFEIETIEGGKERQPTLQKPVWRISCPSLLSTRLRGNFQVSSGRRRCASSHLG